MSTLAEFPLTRIVFIQRVLKFAAVDSSRRLSPRSLQFDRRLAVLSQVCDSWHETVTTTNFGVPLVKTAFFAKLGAPLSRAAFLDFLVHDFARSKLCLASPWLLCHFVELWCQEGHLPQALSKRVSATHRRGLDGVNLLHVICDGHDALTPYQRESRLMQMTFILERCKGIDVSTRTARKSYVSRDKWSSDQLQLPPWSRELMAVPTNNTTMVRQPVRNYKFGRTPLCVAIDGGADYHFLFLLTQYLKRRAVGYGLGISTMTPLQMAARASNPTAMRVLCDLNMFDRLVSNESFPRKDHLTDVSLVIAVRRFVTGVPVAVSWQGEPLQAAPELAFSTQAAECVQHYLLPAYRRAPSIQKALHLRKALEVLLLALPENEKRLSPSPLSRAVCAPRSVFFRDERQEFKNAVTDTEHLSEAEAERWVDVIRSTCEVALACGAADAGFLKVMTAHLITEVPQTFQQLKYAPMVIRCVLWAVKPKERVAALKAFFDEALTFRGAQFYDVKQQFFLLLFGVTAASDSSGAVFNDNTSGESLTEAFLKQGSPLK